LCWFQVHLLLYRRKSNRHRRYVRDLDKKVNHLGIIIEKNLTLTIIDEVTVSTMMHALSNVLVGGEVGGGKGSGGWDSDASLREGAGVGTCVFSVSWVY